MKFDDFANIFSAATGIQETKAQIQTQVNQISGEAKQAVITTLTLQTISTAAACVVATVAVLTYLNRKRR